MRGWSLLLASCWSACFAFIQSVAGHAISTLRGGFTAPNYMPWSHRAHLAWTSVKLISWGQRIEFWSSSP